MTNIFKTVIQQQQATAARQEAAATIAQEVTSAAARQGAKCVGALPGIKRQACVVEGGER